MMSRFKWTRRGGIALAGEASSYSRRKTQIRQKEQQRRRKERDGGISPDARGRAQRSKERKKPSKHWKQRTQARKGPGLSLGSGGAHQTAVLTKRGPASLVTKDVRGGSGLVGKSPTKEISTGNNVLSRTWHTLKGKAKELGCEGQERSLPQRGEGPRIQQGETDTEWFAGLTLTRDDQIGSGRGAKTTEQHIPETFLKKGLYKAIT